MSIFSRRELFVWVLAAALAAACLRHLVDAKAGRLVAGGLSLMALFGYAATSFVLGTIFKELLDGLVWPLYTRHVKRLPVSCDPGQQRDEFFATLYPESQEAKRVAERHSCGVDHLVYTCAKLEDGVQAMERLTGVRASAGGSHPGIGTHNALFSLGDDVYFEIIAPDPSQPTPASPRPFSLDDPSRHNQLVAFAVHPDAAREASIELLAATMQLAGEPPGSIHGMSRKKPDGSELQWRLTPLSRAAGPRPWVIDWGASKTPAQTTPTGCSLVGLTCYGRNATKMDKLLRRTMGLLPLS
eukprot:174893-Prymnesium_polylepis.1